MDVSEFIFLLKLFKSFSNVIHSGGGCYKRSMKYLVAFYAGSEKRRKSRVKKKYIFFWRHWLVFFLLNFLFGVVI